MKPQYLRVRNWERFQHYTNRRPPWVKYHVELLDDYELLHLPVATQLVFDRLLLLAARTDNNIPHDPDHIGRQITIEPEVVTDAIERLLYSDHLVMSERKRAASRAIAKRKQSKPSRGGTETEPEPEAEKELEPDQEGTDGANFLVPGALGKLMDALTDRDELTVKRLSSMNERHPFSEADYVAAWEAATGPGVKSPSAVAIAELKKRAAA